VELREGLAPDTGKPAESPAQPVEEEKQHWRQVKCEYLRNSQPPKNRDTEGLPQLRSRSQSEGDWNHASGRGERGHHDGAETLATGLQNSLVGRETETLMAQSCIHDQNSVFLRYPYKQQDADPADAFARFAAPASFRQCEFSERARSTNDPDHAASRHRLQQQLFLTLDD
jgi:hypothetical protein